MVDFYALPRPAAPEEASPSRLRAADLTIARWSTLAWALVATAGALLVDPLGTVVKAMGIINGFCVGPLLSAFLLGLLTKRANSFGAFAGMIAGTALRAVVRACRGLAPAALQPP